MRKAKYCVIGAGFAGRVLAKESLNGDTAEIAAFLDDDPAKIGTQVETVPVLGPVKEALKSIDKHNIILIAIPSLARSDLSRLYQYIKAEDFDDVRILPALSQLIAPTGSLALIKEPEPSDFLGRDPIILDMRKALAYLGGKRVMVTGAGGSIGSELARQLLIGGASRLFLFGHGENSIYSIEKELKILQAKGIGTDAKVVPIIGELQDGAYIKFLIKHSAPDVIFHCAAHKHVPLMEANPVEAVKNNVFGVDNIVTAAKEAGVARFVLVSTDKAVEPHNVYGASKTLGEDIVMRAHSDGFPFLVVRFGNVLGSRGSIVPLFYEQIKRGGPLTLTDPAMTRYFMTIPEAVSLVLLAGGQASGSGLYILDMGEPVKIIDLARNMLRLYGYDPDEDPSLIKVIGLRPGERLTETLWGPEEEPAPETRDRLIKVTKKSKPSGAALDAIVARLRPVCYLDERAPDEFRNKQELIQILKEVFPSLERSTPPTAY